MVDLIKFELRKIFCNKILWVFFAVFIIITVFGMYTDYNRMITFVGNKQQFKSMVEKYTNEKYTSDELFKLYGDSVSKSNTEDNLNIDEKFISSYYHLMSNPSHNENKVNIDNISYNYDGVKKHLKELEESNKKDTYEYKVFKKAESLMSKLQKPKNIFKGNLEMSFFVDINEVTKLALIVVGLVYIFSNEYKTKVSYLNLSTKKGKTSLNTAKIITAFIYCTFVFIFATLLSILSCIIIGFPDGSLCLNNYDQYSLFNITINIYIVLSLLFSYLGMIIFSIIVVLLSLITKNVIASAVVPTAIYFFHGLIPLPESISFINHISIVELLKGEMILRGFTPFNVFGNVVLYPYVMIAFSVVLIILLLLLYKFFSRRQVVA